MQTGLRESLPLDQLLLDQTEVYLREQIAPKAALLDANPDALQQAFRELGDRHLLGLRVPSEWQGSDINELTFRAFQELVARYSGALAFLQTQHQSAAVRLAQSSNQTLKQEYLPYMARGQKRIGLGFSQLRRSGDPLVKATPIAGGYCLNGEVPWITGFGCFDDFIIGATLPNGQAVLGLVPLRDTAQALGQTPGQTSAQVAVQASLQLSEGSISLSQPLSLAAMASTNTVTATLTNWFLADAQVIDLKPAGWIQQSDRQNVLQHGFFALGCAQAGLDIVATVPSQPFITNALTALTEELHSCRTGMYQAQAIGDTGMHRLDLRAWSIELAVRCTHAAVIVSRGAANYADHPAQRVYREALAFTVFGQTPAVMEATLARLIQSAPNNPESF